MRAYADSDIEIVERGCTGRCEHCCTIVVDGTVLSDLLPSNLTNDFLKNPDSAITRAQKRDEQNGTSLDNALEKLF